MEAKTTKTKKEQRALSDSKLLESAIKLFGENGYSNTSLVQIAKGAGVTSGLIVQRFETKENLLFEAWKKVVLESFRDADDFLMIPISLFKLIDDYRNLYVAKYEYFCFLKMLLNRAALPQSLVKRFDEYFSDKQIYLSIVEAQKEKRIIDVNPHDLLQAFVLQVVNQIEISDQYGILYPEYEFFLRIFQIANNDNLPRKEQKEKIIKSFIDGFDAICYVYLKENIVEQLTIPKDIFDLIDNNDAVGTYKNIIEHTIHEDYRQMMLEVYDFDKLTLKFGNRDMLHFCVKDINGNDRLYIFSVAKRSLDGEVLEFLMTVHNN